jgi:hypothetical protein
MQKMQDGLLAGTMPCTNDTERILESLAALEPETLATMHGSAYIGRSDQLLTELAAVIQEGGQGSCALDAIDVPSRSPISPRPQEQ